jgi:hypothetical protein
MKRPQGFTLIALYCGWQALEAFWTQFVGATDAGVTGLSVLSGVFAAVAAEALWRCRPWCFRAFIAYVCVADLAWFANAGNPAFAVVTNEMVTRLLVGVASILYVRTASLKLFGPQPPRITIPAPRP